MDVKQISQQAVMNVTAKEQRKCVDRYLRDVAKMRRRVIMSREMIENGYDMIPGIDYSRDRVKTSNNGDGMERGVIRLIETKEEAESYAEAVMWGIEDCFEMIRMLDDPDEERVITEHYFYNVNFVDIADAMKWSEKTIRRRRDAALEKLYPMIPGEYKISADEHQFLKRQYAGAV